jgi:coenzyme PQQ synthesis protein D (PqqD)
MDLTDWSAIEDRIVSVPDDVVFREMGEEETIMLNVSTGKYHSLDAVATRFFQVLRDTPNVTAARDQLVGDYGQPVARIEADLAQFCGTLARAGLIRVGERLAA